MTRIFRKPLNPTNKEEVTNVSDTASAVEDKLIVPKKVLPAFHSSILPREESSVLDKPATFSGRVKRLCAKSSLVTGLTTVFGLIAVDEFIETTVKFTDPAAPVLSNVAVIAGILGGFVLTSMGIDSAIMGNGKYAPLPPTKRYLELEASSRKSVIAPFSSWDEMFENTGSSTTEKK